MHEAEAELDGDHRWFRVRRLVPPILASRLLSRVWAPEGYAGDTQRGGPLLGKTFSLERSLLRRVVPRASRWPS